MKWFKHYSDLRNSLFVQNIIAQMGVEGYGYYCLLLELLSSKFDGENETFRVSTIELRTLFRVKTNAKIKKFLACLNASNEISDNNLLRCRLPNENEKNLSLNIIEFYAPILVKLKDRDFKRPRPSRAKNAPRIDKNRIEKEEDYILKEKTTPEVEKEEEPVLPKGLTPSCVADLWNNIFKNEINTNKFLQSNYMLGTEHVKKFILTNKMLTFHGKTWDEYFEKIRQSDFLTGRTQHKKRPLGFTWAIDDTNAAKVFQGNFANNQTKSDEELMKDMNW